MILLYFLISLKDVVTSNIKRQYYYRKAPVHMIMTHASSFDRLPLEMISLGWTQENILTLEGMILV